MTQDFDIVILGLTVTSSWGNGHATTWRSLIRGLSGLGYKVLFLERDMPWYAGNRDEPQPLGATTILYQSFQELTTLFEPTVSKACLVIVGSFVPEGLLVGEWVTSVARGRTAFYDIDTPITLGLLEKGSADYINSSLIRKYDAYLSFTGGPLLRNIENTYGSPMARVLFCSVDTNLYVPGQSPVSWDLGYLGTYSDDRQPSLNELLISPARCRPGSQFVVSGPQYPETIRWPSNVQRITHLSPGEHPSFYASQRFTLNVTRMAMKEAGFSPSVRLFEAAACGTPIISDWWEGLETILEIGKEILVARSADDVLRYLRDLTETERLQVAASARRRILAEHTPIVRAKQLRSYLREMNDHISSGAPWRDGRRGQVAGGLANRLEPQQQWQATSSELDAKAVAFKNPGNLHQSTGESN